MTEPEGRDAPEVSGEAIARPATILVIDDQSSNRELARRTLVDEGHRVLTAASGAEAFALWERGAPDCVLLDIRMPDLDGFEVCARLRALPSGKDTPILFLTGLRDLDTFERVLAAGATDYLIKPIQPSELVMRVHTALRLRRVSAERDELYQLLRHQRDGLQRAMLQNEQLSAFLIHDLKNPVTGMKVATGLILTDAQVSPRTREIAEQIAEGAEGLLRMIMNLLDIAKGDEGRLIPSPAPIDFASIITHALATVAFQAKIRRIELQTAVAAPAIHADPVLLRRVIENLVENAIRHAPRGSTVAVSTDPDGDGVRVAVRDQGPGVAPELREVIFDRFVQAIPDFSRSQRGLGLAFCKVAVQAHGGRVWVEDGAPGALFCIWLPRSPA